MTVTSNNGGIPIYHYSKRLIEKEKVNHFKTGNITMNRKARRNLEKKIKKINKGAYIEYEER